MNQKQLNICSQINFTCDSCGREFEKSTAYSPASNLEELKHQPTYCINCVEITREEPKKLKLKSWGVAPVNETTENLTSLNLDRRSLRKTGRIHLFATRMKKEWIEKLKAIAYEERKHYNEVLEEMMECYERGRK